MALDPLELARQLESLRLAHGQSKEKAAAHTGISIRQYRRLTSDDPPPARLSTIEKVADAYNVDVGELVGEITHTNGTLTERITRLEDVAEATAQGVQEILTMWRDELLPRLDDLEPATDRTTPRAARPKPTRARRRRAS